MHITPSVVQWKEPSPPVSPTPITGFHVRVKDSTGALVTQATFPVGTPDANGFLSAPFDAPGGLDLSGKVGQSLTVTVASTSASDGESSETSSAPFTVVGVLDAPDAPTVVQVG